MFDTDSRNLPSSLPDLSESDEQGKVKRDDRVSLYLVVDDLSIGPLVKVQSGVKDRPEVDELAHFLLLHGSSTGSYVPGARDRPF